MSNDRVLKLKIGFVKTHEKAQIPKKKHASDSGFDLCAVEKVALLPRTPTLVSTGLKISLPKGYEAQVRSRSGLALKQNVCVLNSPGTVDNEYTGELGVILINHGSFTYFVEEGDRVAQLVIAPVVPADSVEIQSVEETVRGEGGFGSTGR